MTTDMWYQLPPDMNAWNNAVIENVAQKIPSITNYIAGIEWNKLDPSTGDADGVIQLLNGMCAAPITIRGAKLAPIDVLASNYGSEPKFYPLSETFLQKIYADNVVGQPVEKGASDEEDYLGPSVKIKHIRTVDNVKYASPEAANNMLNMIIKSASVANWMVENMPETIVALSNRAADINEKLASSELELPDLMMVWKDKDSYYANGKEVTSATVADFCKMANATIEERQGLIYGIPIVRDYREKVASIHIPTEQEIVAMDITDSAELFNNSTIKNKYPEIAITTAYLKDGTSRRGLVFTSEVLNSKKIKSTAENINPQDNIPEITPIDYKNLYKPELFISSDGYGISSNIKTDARLEVSLDLLKKVSTTTDPAIGMIGIYTSKYSNIYFGRIEDIMINGELRFIRIYDLINHELTTIKDEDGCFYEVIDERLPVVSKEERTQYISLTGVNGVLTRNSDGRLVLDGESHTIINCPFALMNKYAAAYEDALAICNIASKYGKCEFEVFEPQEKIATPIGSGENNTRNNNNKNTKTGTDDEPKGDVNRQILAQTTPEADMSVDLQNDPQYGFTTQTEGSAPGAGQGTTPNNGQPGGVNPISSKDLENVVQINSPKVMDAYVMAGLAQNGGSTSQENLLRTSDAIITALEYLSKLLFLNRQGSMEFVSENDLQAAIQKLNDIISGIGAQTSRIAQ